MSLRCFRIRNSAIVNWSVRKIIIHGCYTICNLSILYSGTFLKTKVEISVKILVKKLVFTDKIG